MIEYPAVRIEKSDVAYFNAVDDIVGRSVAAGDPMIAFEYVQGLQREGFIKGLAIAKLLYRIKQSWELFRIAGTDDEFENVVEASLGYRPQTTTKYIRMWESVFENSDLNEDTKMMLMGKPIETLLLLTAAAREGALDHDDWEEIARSSDKNAVREKIKERRGEQTSSKNARPLSIYLRERGSRMIGTLLVTVDGTQKIIGHLDWGNSDEDVQQAIERIINKLNMYEIY